jgi:hypothetical protein
MPAYRSAAGLAAAACAFVLLPSIAAQGPGGTADEVARRIAQWESHPTLRPFATLAPPSGPGLPWATGVVRPDTARWLSLHIGVNRLDPGKYPGVVGLQAPENDAQELAALARARGFTPTVLLSEEATTARVLAEIRRAGLELRTGDLFFITFSGHGSLIPDYNGDHYPRRTDQAFCLYDRMLVDDEVVDLWPTFADRVRVVLLIDSCYSGTSQKAEAEYRSKKAGEFRSGAREDPLARLATRSAGADEVRIRALRPAQHPAVVRVQEAELRQVTTGLNIKHAIENTRASVLRLAACRGDQVSLEMGQHGLFTRTLIDLWNDGRFSGTYRDLIDQAARRTSPYQEPTLDYYGDDVLRLINQPPFSP